MNFLTKNKILWRTGLIILGAYTAIAIVNLPSSLYFNAKSPQPLDWWTLTARLFWGMYAWVLVAPIILWLGYRFRIARPDLLRNITIHLLAAIVIGVIRFTIYNFGQWGLGIMSLETALAEMIKTANYLQAITGSIISYPSVIAIQQAYLYFRESQERAFRLQQAELEVLKMQLQPHFFFNTLNAISALMYRSPKDADEMIIRLGDIFRIALKRDKAQEITLKEEMEFLRAFLQIHQTLMGERLKIEWAIEPETLDALVPNLILQPLAENAIQHGLSPLERGGRIKICAARQNGSLLLQVNDDGQGFVSQNGNKSNGIGLANVRARLENLYGSRHNFSIDKSVDKGVSIKMKIPFRES